MLSFVAEPLINSVKSVIFFFSMRLLVMYCGVMDTTPNQSSNQVSINHLPLLVPKSSPSEVKHQGSVHLFFRLKLCCVRGVRSPGSTVDQKFYIEILKK